MSGPYTGTWGGFTIGTNNDDGYQLACTIQGQEVNETDAYGMTLVEAIYRGQNWRARFRALEWTAGALLALQAFGEQAQANNFRPILINIGDKYTTYALPLVLNAILGNPPTTPRTLTATNAIVAPNSTSEFNMTSKMRELPLEMCLIPYATVVGSITFKLPFSTT